VELPFTHFRQALYQQLREMFPTTRDVARLGEFLFTEDEDVLDWMDKMKTEWQVETTERYNSTYTTENLFYDRLCKNLPDWVRDKLMNVVGWDRFEGPTKEDHISHHCRAWKKMKIEERARKAGLDTLLKAQLVQLDKGKPYNLTVAVTSAALQQQHPPPPAPQFHQAPATQFPPHSYWNPQPLRNLPL
jgi:hypothetical protein